MILAKRRLVIESPEQSMIVELLKTAPRAAPGKHIVPSQEDAERVLPAQRFGLPRERRRERRERQREHRVAEPNQLQQLACGGRHDVFVGPAPARLHGASGERTRARPQLTAARRSAQRP